MPTYQYTCTACDQPLEVVQSFSDAALTECPACGGRLRKVYGAVGVVFKGSGFYKTDSRAKVKSESSSNGDGGSKKDAAPAAKSDSSGSSGSSAGSGSTPAATTTSKPAAKSA